VLGWKKLLGVFAFGAIAMGVMTATVPQVRERIARTTHVLSADETGVDNALSGRGRIWGAALCMAREHPVNGVGARGFREAFPACDPDPSRPPAWGSGPALRRESAGTSSPARELKGSRGSTDDLRRPGRQIQAACMQVQPARTQVCVAPTQLKPAPDQFQAAQEQVKAALDQVKPALDQFQAAHAQVKAAHAQVKAALDQFPPAFEQVKAALDQLKPARDQVKAATMTKKAATMQVGRVRVSLCATAMRKAAT